MFLRSYEGKTRKWPAIVIGLAVAAVVAAPAEAEADVINGKSAKCSTDHRFPAVYKIAGQES